MVKILATKHMQNFQIHLSCGAIKTLATKIIDSVVFL